MAEGEQSKDILTKYHLSHLSMALVDNRIDYGNYNNSINTNSNIIYDYFKMETLFSSNCSYVTTSFVYLLMKYYMNYSLICCSDSDRSVLDRYQQCIHEINMDLPSSV